MIARTALRHFAFILSNRRGERPLRPIVLSVAVVACLISILGGRPAAAVAASPTLPEPAAVSPATSAADTEAESDESTGPVRRFSDDGEPLTTLVFPKAVPIDTVAFKIRDDTGVTLSTDGQARGQSVTVPMMSDVPVSEAIKRIAGTKGWVAHQKGPDEWVIVDQVTFQKEYLVKQVIQKIIRPRNISAEEAQKAVERMLTPNVGSITSDARTNQIVVRDLLPVVEAIVRMINLLDQKVVLRVFTIKHADPQQVLDILQEEKSPPGRLELMPKVSQIIAQDTYENIQRMEVMVDILDRGPETRVYDLNNFDFEGAREDELRKLLEKEIITPEAYLEFDLENGIMILIDTPEVHEEVEELLKRIDKPARQLYIQAEIVETSISHSFEMGLDWTVRNNAAQGTTGSSPGTTGTGLTDIVADISQLGFHDLVAKGDAGGLIVDYLSRHARLHFVAVMEDSETQILAQPRILVKNRQPATITDGGTISYATTTYYGGYGGGIGGFQNQAGIGGFGGYVPSVGSGSVPTGVTLTVDPNIMNNGLVEMRIMLTNITGTPVTRSLGSQDYTLVDTSNQTIDTVLVIPDAQTRMIGGLIENRDSGSVNGIPYLKDIPIIGSKLFGKEKTGPIRRRTLLMFITPSVVQEQPRKYSEPIDDDEKTPPTFYEQASWSAAAVRRAVEDAFGEVQEKYPDFPFPERETEAPRRTTGIPVDFFPSGEMTTSPTTEARRPKRSVGPIVRLEHTPTSPSVETEKPPVEEPPTEEAPPVEEPPDPTPELQIPPSPSPEKTPPVPTPTPQREFPKTGARVLEKGPPRVLLSSRRPGDLAEPEPPPRPAKTSVAALLDEYEGLTSHELVVIGADGRSVAARASGQLLDTPDLGMMQIPMAAMVMQATPARKAVRTPIGRRTPVVRRTPIRRPTPPGGRPTPVRPSGARVTPLRPTPRPPLRTPSMNYQGPASPYTPQPGARVYQPRR